MAHEIIIEKKNIDKKLIKNLHKTYENVGFKTIEITDETHNYVIINNIIFKFILPFNCLSKKISGTINEVKVSKKVLSKKKIQKLYEKNNSKK